MLTELESIGFNTSAAEINISSIVVNMSEVIVNTQDIEYELQENRTGIYLVKDGTDNLSYIRDDFDILNANASWIPSTYPNLSYINDNTSSSLVEVSAINSNVSYGFRFGGQVYQNYSGGNNNASRFESTSILLRDFVIKCTTQDMNLGDSANQSFVLITDAAWGGIKIDLNSLWFKNSSTDTDGYLSILGVRE